MMIIGALACILALLVFIVLGVGEFWELHAENRRLRERLNGYQNLFNGMEQKCSTVLDRVESLRSAIAKIEGGIEA